jgi:signal transduction histidine kinase
MGRHARWIPRAAAPAGTEAQLAGFTELAATAIAHAQARVELRGFAEEQAGRLLHADYATMGRCGPDGTITVVATWSSAGAAFPVGTRWSIGGQNVSTLVFQTARPTRIDDRFGGSGLVAEVGREFGIGAAVGVPVSVEGRLWGVMAVASRAGPMPAGAEAQLAGFTELAATAIANAQAQSALTASRARIVATADATRRRIERNLHDGAQQRLVSLALGLRAARATAPAGAGEHAQQLDEVAAGLDGVMEELREIASGLHPAILTDGGLQPAVKTLARRSAVSVRLDIQVEGRLPEPVETAAYYSGCTARPAQLPTCRSHCLSTTPASQNYHPKPPARRTMPAAASPPILGSCSTGPKSQRTEPTHPLQIATPAVVPLVIWAAPTLELQERLCGSGRGHRGRTVPLAARRAAEPSDG